MLELKPRNTVKAALCAALIGIAGPLLPARSGIAPTVGTGTDSLLAGNVLPMPQGTDVPRRSDPTRLTGGTGIPRPAPPGSPGGAMLPRRASQNTDDNALNSDVADESWLNWWQLNRDWYLDVERRYRSRAEALEANSDIFVSKAGNVDAKPVVVGGLSREHIIDVLTPLLSNDHFRVRAEAAVAIGRIGLPSALPRLIPVTKDSNLEVRRAALMAIGLLESEVAVPFLTHAVADHSAQDSERAWAAIALGLIGGDRATTPLIAILEGSERVREIDAAALFGLGLTDAVRARVFLEYWFLDASHDDTLRAVALNALGLHRSPLSLETILAALGDRDVGIRRSAAIVAGAIDFASPKLTEFENLRRDNPVWDGDGVVMSHGEDIDSRITTLELEGREEQRTLDAQKARTVAMLYEAAAADADLMVRNFATMALGELGSNEARSALRRLGSEASSSILRPWVFLAMGITGSTTFAADLAKELSEKRYEHETRSAILLSLGLLDYESATLEIGRSLKAHADRDVTGFAALALGLLNRREYADGLRRDLVSKSRPELKEPYGLALGLMGDREAIDGLSHILGSSAPVNTKREAAKALGAIKDERVVDRIVDLLEDAALKDEAKAAVVRSLGVIAERGELPILSPKFRHLNYLLPVGPMRQIALL